ncbi:MAG: recombinase family protein [Terriglobia bacterium]|jgi:DNA invertase Pin-like site-specific DNA recombinase
MVGNRENSGVQENLRCAAYARYSSDLQRPASIDDQVRNCRKYAALAGWTIAEDYVRSDAELTGQTLNSRGGLESLIADAKRSPRPFDCVLIDDTSRFGRNLPDVLKLAEIFKYNGVSLYFVSQRLDSRVPDFRILLTIHGLVDEQYIVGVRDKVHRGQEGRVLAGYNPGGKCYGYRNIPVEDPTRRGEYGRAAILGVRLEIVEEQAVILRQIFEMYAAGHGLGAIAKYLNARGIRSPQPPRKSSIRAWCPSGIRNMLRNERYRGVVVWNRTHKVRNPETGREVMRRRPEPEHVRAEHPNLRIISEELWNEVEAHIRGINEHGGFQRLGGMNRTAQSRTYIFSGKLQCECGANMVIGGGGGAYVKYVCPSARYRGICSNKLYIRRDRLEEQLLNALASNLRRPELLEGALESFKEQLECRAREIRQTADSINEPQLRVELEKATERARNLVEAIAVQRTSPFLSQELARVEGRINEITTVLNAPKRAEQPQWSHDELRQFVLRKAGSLVELLQGDPKLAKEAIHEHVGKLVLKPKQTVEGPVFEVTGDIDLFGGDSSVMLNNPGKGIAQHYKPFRVPFGPLVLAAGPARPARTLRPLVLHGFRGLDACAINVFLDAAAGVGPMAAPKNHAEFYVFPMALAMNRSGAPLAP